MKNKKMAIIRPDGNPIPKGFYNSQEIGLAKGISKLNIDVDIFMAGSLDEIEINRVVTHDDHGIITVYRLPKYIIPEISQAIYPNLIKLLKKSHYDLIQVNESNDITSFLVSYYAKKNNIPCIIYQGMYIDLPGKVLTLFQRLFNFFILPFFKKNIILAVTKTHRAKHYLEGKGFIQTSVIPVGLDVEPFLKSTTRDWHNEYNLPLKSKILLYIGTTAGRRNINFLIDIALKLKDKNYILLIAGKGPEIEHKEIEERIKANHISNVILLGMVPQYNIKSLYEIADFFLLASNYEIYGMVVLEALYCGCPVISTKTAGPEDIIQPGVNGYIIEHLSVELWANKIEETSGNFDREAISAYIQKHLTWDVIAKKYVNLFFNK